nr:nitroreductase family protein [Bacteroidales bacterium]
EKGKSGFFRGEQANEVGDGWGAYDNGLSNAYFILKARTKGFDTLIMGMRDSDSLRTLFNIPENEAIMAVISLGYRADEPNQPKHRPLDEVVRFFEHQLEIIRGSLQSVAKKSCKNMFVWIDPKRTRSSLIRK